MGCILMYYTATQCFFICSSLKPICTKFEFGKDRGNSSLAKYCFTMDMVKTNVHSK